MTAGAGVAPIVFHDESLADQHRGLRDRIVEDMKQRYVWHEIPCVICGSSDHTIPAFSKWGIQMCRCTRCDHLFVSPRLPEEAVSDLYGSTYWNEYSKATGNPTISERARFDYENAFYKLRRDVFPWKSAGRLLDVGASNGGLVRAAREVGFAAEGIEPAADVCRVAQQVNGVELHCGDIRNQIFPAEYFDIVTLHDVIEHVFEPLELLKAIRRILVPGGIVIMETPTTDSLQYKLNGMNWPYVSPLEHINLFSEHNLARLVCMSGLLIRDVYCPHENDVIVVGEAA